MLEDRDKILDIYHIQFENLIKENKFLSRMCLILSITLVAQSFICWYVK